jgi:hypothetical protein
MDNKILNSSKLNGLVGLDAKKNYMLDCVVKLSDDDDWDVMISDLLIDIIDNSEFNNFNFSNWQYEFDGHSQGLNYSVTFEFDDLDDDYPDLSLDLHLSKVDTDLYELWISYNF